MAKIKDFVDCFVLMNTALSLSGGKKLGEMSRPQIHGLESTIVNISVSVQNVYLIDAKKMELEVILFLHQRWVDSRLGANFKTKRMAVTEQIWKPKITFINGKLRNIENREDFVFWRGSSVEGNILLSEKLILSTFCTSNYKYFPFDQQLCQLKFGSYRFPKYEVDLYWFEEPIEIENSLKVEEFKLLNVTTYATVEKRPSGDFPVLIIELTFQRYSLHYILCIGLPSTLVIVLSYVVQFLKKEDRRIRCIIIMNCLIALLIVHTLSTCSQEVTGYLKALDVYNLINITFIIFGILETSITDFWLFYANVIHSKRYWLLKLFSWMNRSFKIAYMLMYLSSIIIYCLFVM